jgi:hypothetical protein
MAARKKRAARKSAARKSSVRTQLRSLAARFEKQLEQAALRYRSEAARLLRQAGVDLERLERRGESALHQLDAKARRRTLGLLADLQRTVRSAKLDTAKGELRARRAVASAKSAMRKAASRVAP